MMFAIARSNQSILNIQIYMHVCVGEKGGGEGVDVEQCATCNNAYHTLSFSWCCFFLFSLFFLSVGFIMTIVALFYHFCVIECACAQQHKQQPEQKKKKNARNNINNYFQERVGAGIMRAQMSAHID
eukprot:m.88823 g.88823  ORF g.88823 m.88823 type:complete len:127 (-) comp8816_c5_seq1:1841-2221(-)